MVVTVPWALSRVVYASSWSYCIILCVLDECRELVLGPATGADCYVCEYECAKLIEVDMPYGPAESGVLCISIES